MVLPLALHEKTIPRPGVHVIRLRSFTHDSGNELCVGLKKMVKWMWELRKHVRVVGDA